jgi:ketosteroid isomerase-like protein
MKSCRSVLAVLGFAVLIATAACSQYSGYDAEEDRAAITDASLAFSAAFMAGDTTALGALYTENAILMPPSGNVHGNEAIRTYFAPAEERQQVGHKLISESLLIEGDVAIDMGRWESTTQLGDAEPRTSSERYLVVWQRQPDGSWRISYDAWHWPRPNN